MWTILLYYFMLFFIYSFLGWIVETIACSLIEKKIVLNRGFLIGPYLPIYGTAATLMILFLTEYKHEPFILFCMAVVYASLLEYFTSLLMEKIFHARWWNYTHEKFNLNGRICLKNCLFFGVLGFFVLYVVHPGITFFIDKIPTVLFNIVAITILTFFISDVILTLYILSKLNIQIKNIQSDATEEIDKEVKKLLKRYRRLYRRLLKSFPRLSFTNKHGDILIARIRNQFDEVDEFLEKKKKEIREVKEKIKELKEKSSTKEILKTIEEEKQKLKEIRKRKI